MAPKVPEEPLANFCKRLAVAEGDKSHPDKYRQALDDLFNAAGNDPAIELVVMLRTGDDVTLLGIRQGTMIDKGHEFERILKPIVRKLSLREVPHYPFE